MNTDDQHTTNSATSSQEEKNQTNKSTTPTKIKQKHNPNSHNWTLGLAIMVIGGLLLARNLGVELPFLSFHNWWAFFILLAAIGPLQQAYISFRTEGVGTSMFNSLISAAIIIFVALIFLADLSFKIWWPVFVILGGLYMMTNRSRV